MLYVFHGAGCALRGITALNWSAAEYFASPEYQKKVGGAYIIVPLANETTDRGHTIGTWMTPLAEGQDLTAYPSDIVPMMRRLFGADAPRLTALLGVNSVYTDALIRLFDEAVSHFSSAGKTIVMGTSAGGYCAWRYILSRRVDAALIMAGAYLPSEAELARLEAQGLPLWICQGKHDECVPYAFSIGPVLSRLRGMTNVSLYLP